MKRYIVSLILTFTLLSQAKGDNCDLWISQILQNDTSVCHSANVTFDVSVENDSMNLDSCKYEWFVKVPGESYTSQGISIDSTLSYFFNQSGVFYITCQVTPDTCPTINTDTISVTVYTLLTAGTILGDDTICYGSQPNLIQISELPTGCDGVYDFQWQDSVSGGEWNVLCNHAGPTYQPGNLTETTYYRRKVTNVLCNESAYTEPVLITVFQPLTSGSVFYDDTICYNSQPSAIQSTEPPTGCAGQYVYQWQDSVAGGVWTDILNSNSESYTPRVLTETTYFRRKVTDTICQETQYTQPVTVFVLQPFYGGSVANGQVVCYNETPGNITSLERPSGGSGYFGVVWQDSIAGGTWHDIENSFGMDYWPSFQHTTTTYYRRKAVDSYCGDVAYSNVVEIVVRQPLNNPVISQITDTICYDSIPALLSVTEPTITELGDSILYQWQDSITGGVWTDIAGATSLTYQPPALQTTHYYRVYPTSYMWCRVSPSNVTEIAVFDDLQLTITGPQAPICYQTSSDVVVTATGAGGRYTYQWQDSVGGVWSNVGTNDSTLSVTADTEGFRYVRCIVSSTNGCSSKTSSVFSIQMYSELNAGQIIPVDTICYGTQPDSILSSAAASGCDNVFTYSWAQSTDGQTWSIIPNANNATYRPSVLTQNTYYRRKAHNAYCNVDGYSDSILIVVRQTISAPVVGQHLDTVCYNFAPDMLSITTPSICAESDTVRYQWQDSEDSITWSNIQFATNLTYQPGALVESRYYRVVATSEKGCGEYPSNVIKINVYDDLVIVNNPVDTICYMTSAQLTFTATGEGGKYAYQWQESSDSINFTDIRNEKRSDYWTEDKPEGKYYYRCIVTPKNGCSVDTSDVFVVNVYGEFKAGQIGSNQVVCKNENASELNFLVMPSGGETNKYTYQWEYSVDLEDWNNVQGETSTTYTPLNMQQTTYYRVRVRNSCGLEYTDTIEIFVNPLPDTVIISGNQSVCINKYEYYEIEELKPGFDYQWSLDNQSVGVILTNPSNELQIRVLWTAVGMNSNVVLTVTNTETGCISVNYYPVTIANEQTPDTTIIIRKPNSNIFVCQDSITDHYQWGSTERSSGVETRFTNCDRRYCQVSSGIDTTNYIYWLDMWNGDSARCVNRSIYTPSNDDIYIQQPKQSIKVVSTIKEFISFEIANPSGKEVSVNLYSIAGVKLMGKSFGNSETIKAHLPVDIPSGVYLLRVEIGTDCETFKLIAE